MARKPWEIPITYNDDRFDDAADAAPAEPADVVDADAPGEREAAEVEALLSREERPPHDAYDGIDDVPVDYANGPHQEEFGVDDGQFDTPDDDPVPYENGAHDDEFGFDDEE
jgi:hypothetical protein